MFWCFRPGIDSAGLVRALVGFAYINKGPDGKETPAG
jgi:hypothetical protein